MNLIWYNRTTYAGLEQNLNCNSVKFMIILTYVLVIINNKNCEQQQISDE